jgi:hypothetical protein
VEPLFPGESGSVRFGTKVVPSLNGVDPSFELSCWILLVEPSGSNILHDILMKTCDKNNFGENVLDDRNKKEDSKVGIHRTCFNHPPIKMVKGGILSDEKQPEMMR